MKPTQEMYTTLFNGITDARNQLREAMALLDSIQQKAENLYLENPDASKDAKVS